jgi:hypothetical protein
MPTRTMMPTRTLVPPPTPTATPTDEPGVTIGTVNCKGKPESLSLRNSADFEISVTGWEIRSIEGGETLRLPSRRLGPRRSLLIFSGPDATPPEPPDILWASREIWKDDDDRAELRDRDGVLRSQRSCPTPRPTTTAWPSLTPSATLTPVPRPSAAPTVGPLPPLDIQSLDCRGPVEHVAVINRSTEPIHLEGWALRSDVGGERYAFPGQWLAPGAIRILLSGPDAKAPAPDEPRVRLWTKSDVWDEAGDTATVLDAEGRSVATMSCPQQIDFNSLGCGGPYEDLQLINLRQEPIDLGGWYLHALRRDDWFLFPVYRLRPGRIVILGSGPLAPGTDQGSDYFHWTHEALWHDLGDTAELFDAEGRLRGRTLCR